jgi:hypothetical protein
MNNIEDYWLKAATLAGESEKYIVDKFISCQASTHSQARVPLLLEGLNFFLDSA